MVKLSSLVKVNIDYAIFSRLICIYDIKKRHFHVTVGLLYILKKNPFPINLDIWVLHGILTRNLMNGSNKFDMYIL